MSVSFDLSGFVEAERPALVALLRAYEASLGMKLDFQRFEEELAELPGEYGAPDGALVLAWRSVDRMIVGCVGMRPFDRAAGIAEMKRLFIVPEVRGHGLGRRLASAAIDAARHAGYGAIRLDTLPSMTQAQRLYAELGFRDIANYNGNPVAGSRFLEKSIAQRP